MKTSKTPNGNEQRDRKKKKIVMTIRLFIGVARYEIPPDVSFVLFGATHRPARCRPRGTKKGQGHSKTPSIDKGKLVRPKHVAAASWDLIVQAGSPSDGYTALLTCNNGYFSLGLDD